MFKNFSLKELREKREKMEKKYDDCLKHRDFVTASDIVKKLVLINDEIKERRGF